LLEEEVLEYPSNYRKIEFCILSKYTLLFILSAKENEYITSVLVGEYNRFIAEYLFHVLHVC
jgi:hypothetical protein